MFRFSYAQFLALAPFIFIPSFSHAQLSVDAKMAPFESAAGSEATALSKSPSLLQMTVTAEDYARITHPGQTASTGNPQGHTEVACGSIPRDGLGVILIVGQSNASNAAGTSTTGQYFTTSHPVFNYNIGDGKCYVASNPLLGSDALDYGAAGHVGQAFSLPLGSYFRDVGLFERVLLVPVAVSGTWIEEWVPGTGHYFPRVSSAITGLAQMGLAPHMILWHQGEGNSGWLQNNPNASQTVKDALRLSYMRNFLSLVAGIRTLNVTAPVFIANATVCGGSAQNDIRKAQQDVVDATWKIAAGPDTDALPFSLRRDGCHFSHEGNQVHARSWYDAIMEYLTGSTVVVATSKTTVNPGENITLAWYSQKTSSCNLTYSYADGSPPVSFNVQHNQSQSGSTGVVKTTTFSFRCMTLGGFPITDSVTVTVSTPLPTVSLNLNNGLKTLQIGGNGSYTLSYNISGAKQNSGDACIMSYSQTGGTSGTFPIATNASGAASGSGTSGLVGSYTLTCENAAGQKATDTVTITNPNAPPAVSLTINGVPNATVQPGSTFTLAYSSSNSTSCEITNAQGGIAAVAPNTSGTSLGGAPAAGQTLTYKFSCKNNSGMTEKTATVTSATPPKPTITGKNTDDARAGTEVAVIGTLFDSNNTILFNGAEVTHVPSSNNGTRLTFTIPTLWPPGSYTLTIKNSSGTSNGVAIRVHAPPLSVDFTVNGEQSVTLAPGAPFTIRWSSAHATACTLTNAQSGATNIPPNTSNSSSGGAPSAGQTLLYKFSCSGSGSTIEKSVTVTGQ